ncbi:heme A synthase, partial [Nocardia farcinica]|nr:heme A synthase [Nocardia farcinica]
IGLALGLLAIGAPKAVRTRMWVLLGLVLAQGLVGVVQYFTDVPAALVVLHVGGAAACTSATAALWASLRTREVVSAPATDPAVSAV